MCVSLKASRLGVSKMKKLRILLVKAVTVVSLAGCASFDLDERLTNLDSLEKNISVKSYVEQYGPPFSVELEEGFTFTHYLMAGKTSAGTFIPVVGLLGASGNHYAVQRNKVKFNEQGLLVGVIQSEQKQGFISMYAMPKYEGFTGSGGKRSQKDFVKLGRFLAEKGVFFEQERWKSQNIANNYFAKFSQK